ncbi:hypothetical protein Vretimale_7272 [Volvox reticuliferus]|uniref:Secreted protein n=1 Tax=Volvox reticuliferus TaxID=1737510 RepID=A0A8J4G8U0_9CHLO|nr:hypothetical protein Vretimale_7272 [Volvox reticuliferus]
MGEGLGWCIFVCLCVYDGMASSTFTAVSSSPHPYMPFILLTFYFPSFPCLSPHAYYNSSLLVPKPSIFYPPTVIIILPLPPCLPVSLLHPSAALHPSSLHPSTLHPP